MCEMQDGNKLPGFRARLQKSGKIYYYLEHRVGSRRKEIPLGGDLQLALLKRVNLLPKTDTNQWPTVTYLHQVCDLYKEVILPAKSFKIRQENTASIKYIRTFSVERNILFEMNVRKVNESAYIEWRGSKAPIRARREWSLVANIQNWYFSLR